MNWRMPFSVSNGDDTINPAKDIREGKFGKQSYSQGKTGLTSGHFPQVWLEVKTCHMLGIHVGVHCGLSTKGPNPFFDNS
jgi:adenosine deaminase